MRCRRSGEEGLESEAVASFSNTYDHPAIVEAAASRGVHDDGPTSREFVVEPVNL
jgi:hypothetical protein